MGARMYKSLWDVAFGLVTLRAPATAQGEWFSLEGNWAGRYTYTSFVPPFGTQNGKMTLSIASNGKVTGVAHNFFTGQRYDLSGSIDEDGELKITIEGPNEFYTGKGVVTKTRNGNLKGTLTQYSGSDATGSIQLDLPSK
jgi:hypothetical protein